MLIEVDRKPLMQYLLDNHLAVNTLALQAGVSDTVIRNILAGRKIRLKSAGKIFKLLPELKQKVFS